MDHKKLDQFAFDTDQRKKQLNTGFSADRLFSFFNKEATDGNRF